MMWKLTRLEDRLILNATPPRLLADAVVSLGSAPSVPVEAGSILYFSANNGPLGTELYKRDSGGVSLVKDIRPGSASSSPSVLTNVNGVLYFTANDGVNGAELWRSDGTSNGTVMVADIRTGSAGSGPSLLTAVNSRVFFTANDGVTGAELWSADKSGVTFHGNIDPAGLGSTPSIGGLTNVNGTLFFRIRSGTIGGTGIELWKSDGTVAGTQLVKDIRPDTSGSNQDSNPENLINWNGTLYFSARDNTSPGLWMSDGTSAGTVMIQRFPFDPNWSDSIENFTILNSTLVFTRHNRELWKSDGTSGGTVLIRTVGSGDDYGNLRGFTELNGKLYFAS